MLRKSERRLPDFNHSLLPVSIDLCLKMAGLLTCSAFGAFPSSAADSGIGAKSMKGTYSSGNC